MLGQLGYIQSTNNIEYPMSVFVARLPLCIYRSVICSSKPSYNIFSHATRRFQTFQKSLLLTANNIFE